MEDAIRKFAAEDKAIFGTCAGAILLATEVKNPHQDSLKLLDMTVLRNGYGRQVHSDVVSGPSTLRKEPLEMVFIRGPVIERVGPNVEVLAEYAGKPALVQKGHILASAFHPELTSDTTVHRHFLDLVGTRHVPENSGREPLEASVAGLSRHRRNPEKHQNTASKNQPKTNRNGNEYRAE